MGSRPGIPAFVWPPMRQNRRVREAARAEAEALKKRKGYSQSIVTGPQGVITPPTTDKTLLGQ